MDSATSASRVPPHAKPFVERTLKLEVLPVVELARRVADGLARLRAEFQLETRRADPLGALFAALPDTEIGRLGVQLERDLAAARELASERERAAAEVDRRSESLKEALRERSADLAAALARVSTAEAERDRVLVDARASTDEIEQLRLSLARATDEHAAELAQASAEGEERARLEREVAARATEIEGLRGELELLRGDVDVLRIERDALRGEQTSLRERLTSRDAAGVQSDAEHRAQRELLRAASIAAEARCRSARDVLELDRAALLARATAREVEIEHLAGERSASIAEIAAVREQAHRVDRARVQALEDAQRVVAELRTKISHCEHEAAWRAREMEAVRTAASGIRWKLFGGDLAERVAGWSTGPRDGGAA